MALFQQAMLNILMNERKNEIINSEKVPILETYKVTKMKSPKKICKRENTETNDQFIKFSWSWTL